MQLFYFESDPIVNMMDFGRKQESIKCQRGSSGEAALQACRAVYVFCALDVEFVCYLFVFF